jgi:hypothetical protein
VKTWMMIVLASGTLALPFGEGRAQVFPTPVNTYMYSLTNDASQSGGTVIGPGTNGVWGIGNGCNTNCTTSGPTNTPASAIFARQYTPTINLGSAQADWAPTNGAVVVTNLTQCTVEYWTDGSFGCGTDSLPGGNSWVEQFPYNDFIPNVSVVCNQSCTNASTDGIFIILEVPGGGDLLTNVIGAGTGITTVPRMHIAGEVNGWDRRIYINGQLVAERTGPTNFDMSGPLAVGAVIVKVPGGTQGAMRMAFPRYSNIERYTNNFVPPTSFIVDSNTIALYYFNDGTFNWNYDATSNHLDMYAGRPVCCSTNYTGVIETGKTPW